MRPFSQSNVSWADSGMAAEGLKGGQLGGLLSVAASGLNQVECEIIPGGSS